MTNLTTTRPPDQRGRAAQRPSVASGPIAEIDERLVARREEVAAREAQRRKTNFVVLSIITVVGIMAFAAARSSIADVDGFELSGAVRTDPMAAAAATGIPMGLPLLEVDEDAASAGVTALPWVRHAEVTRNWNGQIAIEVVEREPVISLPTGDGRWVSVDEDGIQLEVLAAQRPGDLSVEGVVASGAVGDPVSVDARRAMSVILQLDSDIAESTSGVLVVGHDVSLMLAEGGAIRLGSELGLSDKLDAARTMLAKADLRCLGQIDVRVASSPTLTRVDAEGYPLSAVADLAQCA